MKHVMLVLLLGALSAGGTYFGWLSYRNPCAADGLDCQLDWMRRELQLTPAQYATIRAIHESSTANLISLSAQVAHMRRELAEFERVRSTVGEIDFLEFAQFVEQRRAVDHQSRAATAELVARISDVMNVEQRSRYLALLNTPRSLPNATRYN